MKTCSYFDFSKSYAVVVSGADWNPCGHLLLNTGGLGGYYFHIAEFYGYPKYMDETGYKRYLKENGKEELSRIHVPISNPQACMLKLEELLIKKWRWGGVPNNCASFVEEILQAGGSTAGLYSNCPTKEIFR